MTRSPAHPDAATTAWPLTWPFAAEDEPTPQPAPAAIDAWWPEGDGLTRALGAALTPGAVDPAADAALQRVLSSLGAPPCGLAPAWKILRLRLLTGFRFSRPSLPPTRPLKQDAPSGSCRSVGVTRSVIDRSAHFFAGTKPPFV